MILSCARLHRDEPECEPETMKLHFVLVASLVITTCTPGFAACGDNGGPGYRSQSGKCVGWEALARQCGILPQQDAHLKK
jgi:hypothetical protein